MPDVFLKSVITLNQAEALKLQIEEARTHLYRKSQSPEKVLKRFLPAFVFEAVSAENAAEAEKLLEDMYGKILELPVLSMEIAFEPTQKTIELISGWLEDNLKGNKVLLDLAVNPQLIASARIFFRGKTGDYSLRKKLNERV